MFPVILGSDFDFWPARGMELEFSSVKIRFQDQNESLKTALILLQVDSRYVASGAIANIDIRRTKHDPLFFQPFIKISLFEFGPAGGNKVGWNCSRAPHAPE